MGVANGQSDVQLVFGVAGGGSLGGASGKLINEQLSKIVKSINKNPYKIKFQADEASLKQFDARIKTISSSLGKVVKINVRMPDISGAITKGMEKSVEATAKAANSATTATKGLNAELSKASGAAKVLKGEMTAVNGQAGKTPKEGKFLKLGTTEQSTALKSLDTAISGVTTKLRQFSAAQRGVTSGDYKNLEVAKTAFETLKQKVLDGKMSLTDFRREFANISKGVSSATTNIKIAGKDFQTFGQRVGSLFKKFSSWFSASQIFLQAIRIIRQMTTTVIELDTAMTELKKVTDESEKTYNRFLDNAAVRAKKLGATIKDTVSASADFARLGYSLSESEVLADAAIIYKNVGDGIEDINEASESIISTMKAFGVEANDVMLIVDKFNSVGNKFAISSGGVGEALLRSASAMKTAGNTLNETVALAAAANEVVQNPETVGTSLKTISMYIRAAKDELEEAGESTEGIALSTSELRDDILSMTKNVGKAVDIQLDKNTYKSTYQILKELSEVYDELGDKDQAALQEMLGGKRNANVVAALLTNFQTAEEALAVAAGSAGSAMEENDKYLESISGRLSILKATFEEFSQKLINGNFLKTLIDLGTTLLSILTKVGVVFDGLFWVVNGLASLFGDFGVIGLTSLALISKFSKNILGFFSMFTGGAKTTAPENTPVMQWW